MPAGSTRPRSTSPSSNARSSHPTTSPTSTPSKHTYWPSVAATSRSPHPSNGSSPAKTSTNCRPRPTPPNQPPSQPDPTTRYVAELPSQTTKRACDQPAPALSHGTNTSTDARRPGECRIAPRKQSSDCLQPTRSKVVHRTSLRQSDKLSCSCAEAVVSAQRPPALADLGLTPDTGT